jgi:hypothetical protein
MTMDTKLFASLENAIEDWCTNNEGELDVWDDGKLSQRMAIAAYVVLTSAQSAGETAISEYVD